MIAKKSFSTSASFFSVHLLSLINLALISFESITHTVLSRVQLSSSLPNSQIFALFFCQLKIVKCAPILYAKYETSIFGKLHFSLGQNTNHTFK